MAVDISKYFPDIVQDVREFKEFAKAVNPEFDIARERQEGQLRNQYIMSSDETGIARYERLMGISPMATATLEERRMAVVAGWNSSTPFSERKLIDMLDAICMHDFYLLDLQIVNYRLEVTLELEAKHTRATVEDLLDRIVPLNMAIDVKLKGNTHGNLKDWGYTHAELKAMGVTHGEIAWTVLRR